jgi:hypothetical protein
LLVKVIILVSAVVLLGFATGSAPADLAEDQYAAAGLAFNMPEPATLALLGLGGLVLLPRRVRGR